MGRKDLYLILFCCFAVTGCDVVYGMLQKEGAEEKKLIGETSALEPNKKVAQVQALLRVYGYAAGRVDGVLGPNTRVAISAFQKDNGLTVTHFVDEATWKGLNVFSDSGLIVNNELDWQLVQLALRRAGYDPGSTDGFVGKRTENAIKSFQRANRLRSDGKVGFKTLKKLAAHLPNA
jgi:peptidoglycan hydrolase-like protein with peptidoglycan-binding domain